MGFTFATHFCGGHAVKSEVGFGQHNLDCGMSSMDVDNAVVHNGQPFLSQDCCVNLIYQLDIQDDYQSTIEQITVNPDFSIAFVYTFFNINFPLLEGHNFYTNYTPHPLIKQDVQILFQSFLI
ncbi:hypothetical protein DJ013_10045 [Arcticibacterium luteifluviistationis]|uniref:Uncharacterized protein n=2 Tax=Arcticibacterium luteifluviistationis TaxID=1784714 RepID=A0A2Z4GC33_9BACT|nr:hypothetical protein DJ013_10045 [Arcticibacterium luteifluviistationis]